MLRTFRYPLSLTPQQEHVLTSWLGVCCDLWNAGLQERLEGWRRGLKITHFGQTRALTEVRRDDPELAAMPVEVQRSALSRLHKAFDGFFSRVKRGDKPGYPRWRAKRRYDSFSYPAPKTVVDGAGRSARVTIPKLGDVRVHLYRPLRGKPLQVTIRRGACGRWWACISCDIGAAPELANFSTVAPDRIVGVDLGLSNLATLSTGEKVENPRYAERAAKRLAERQRCLTRKRKGSRSRERARVLVAKAHAHIKNQRLNHARKVAVDLVRRFDVIVFEDLNIRGLARGMLSKSVNNAAWRVLIQATACKAEWAGKRVLEEKAAGSTQGCSACGETVPKDLSVRTHVCPRCGLVLCRDVNAARVMRARGIKALGLSAAPKPVAAGRDRSENLIAQV